jgi:acetyl esterase/lipase
MMTDGENDHGAADVDRGQHGIRVPSFILPPSSYMSEAAKLALLDSQCNPPAIDHSSIDSLRASMDEQYLRPLLDKAKRKYAISVSRTTIAGVGVDVVSPAEGVSAGNAERVLINLHGGAFILGSGSASLLESIPIAAVARIKIISVDYRLGPEHRFPAAPEDVAAVYAELLRDYDPSNIGIYGCSAGGILTTQSIPWLERHQMPGPGAIGVLSGAGDTQFRGDSHHWTYPFMGLPPTGDGGDALGMMRGYYADTDLGSQYASPALHPGCLSTFPPTLLISGTRAEEMSATVHTHNQLIKAGIAAELHLWDGMWHALFYDVDLPESIEVYTIVAGFFENNLGRNCRSHR